VTLAAPRIDSSSESSALAELDEVTLRRAQNSDDSACRALVVRYQRPVFALLFRMLGPGRGSMAEDLAQETFLEVFRSLRKFSPLGPARLSSWILTIASRRAIDELRKRPVATEPIELGRNIVGDQRADEAAVRRAVAGAIQSAVAELSPEYRAAFLLREYHGLEYAEIARALDIDIGTVKSRLSRARAALRETLAEVRGE
jgi:RNA polymerase sigma-70 factor (ECF subfamily)